MKNYKQRQIYFIFQNNLLLKQFPKSLCFSASGIQDLISSARFLLVGCVDKNGTCLSEREDILFQKSIDSFGSKHALAIRRSPMKSASFSHFLENGKNMNSCIMRSLNGV